MGHDHGLEPRHGPRSRLFLILMVEDETGQMRVRIDGSLEVYGALGPRRAIADGDEIEVCGELVEELGDAESYRHRRVTRAFAPGATVLVR